MRGGLGGGSPWAAAQTLGINPLGNVGGNGRNVAMSAMRIHRLRALAVQKLAQAYKADEIASSVMVMQGGSVFDDVAERVLKVGGCYIVHICFKHLQIHDEQIPTTRTRNTSISSTRRFLLANWQSLLRPKSSTSLSELSLNDWSFTVRVESFDVSVMSTPRLLETSHTLSKSPELHARPR